MRIITYTVKIKKEKGEFIVTVPALRGCHTFGATYEEAVVRAKECIEGFLFALRKAGDPIPVEKVEMPSSFRMPIFAPSV